jgi:hypothetical protein
MQQLAARTGRPVRVGSGLAIRQLTARSSRTRGVVVAEALAPLNERPAMIKQLVLAAAALGFTACVTNDEPEVGQRESAVEACVGDLLHFKTFAEVNACEKQNRVMVKIALNSVVTGGGTCTAYDREGACASITPVNDEATASLINGGFDCMLFRVKDGQSMTCCSDRFGGFDSDRCFTAPYELQQY